MHRVFLGLGSNLDPKKHLAEGLDNLTAEFGYLSLSNIYRSSAVGFSGPDFLNMVLEVEVPMELEELSRFLKSLEYSFGRDVYAKKYSSRNLDVDILTFDNYQGVFGKTILPRPEIRFNAHVLCPFAEIAPGLVLPGMTKNLAALWREYDHSDQPLEIESLVDYFPWCDGETVHHMWG